MKSGDLKPFIVFFFGNIWTFLESLNTQEGFSQAIHDSSFVWVCWNYKLIDLPKELNIFNLK